MKKNCLIAGFVMLCGGWLPAQTNTPVAPKPERGPTLITSDSADFDLARRRAIYTGNVRVNDPQMQVTCQELIADLPQSGGHINHLTALTNVVMDSVDDKGQTNHATGDKAIYDYQVQNGVTNETVTLTGHAKVENAQGWLTGEPIVWDRANNTIHAENQKMIFRQSVGSALMKTNAQAARADSRSGTTNLPPAKTNFPPGTIQNIDRMTPSASTTQ